jgi:hypothetical protein
MSQVVIKSLKYLKVSTQRGAKSPTLCKTTLELLPLWCNKLVLTVANIYYLDKSLGAYSLKSFIIWAE